MFEPISGSCHCGAVRYEVGPLSSVVTCHCVDCRKSQGGEFSTNGTAADFRLLRGESELCAYESSPGKSISLGTPVHPREQRAAPSS